MALETGHKLGHYEIRSLIGKGGMGEVYKAHDPRVGRDVAIKVAAAEFSERFDHEVRAGSDDVVFELDGGAEVKAVGQDCNPPRRRDYKSRAGCKPALPCRQLE